MQLSSASFVDGLLSIEVTGDDDVQVSATQGQTLVTFNGRAADIGSVAASDVSSIVVTADAESTGNNRIDLSRVMIARFPQLSGTTLDGGAGSDTILGSAVSDQIDGGAGRDWLDGRAGADVILGGTGRDRLIGGAGDDLLHGGDRADTLSGQAGDDTLCGDAGADSLSGAAGTDCLEGGQGRDTVRGGSGMDNVMGDTKGDVIRDATWHHVPAATVDSGEDAGDGFGGSSSEPQFATLAEPEAPLTISVSSVSQTESSSTTMMFSVWLSPTPTSTVIVNYSTIDGTAVNGSDYTAVSGALTFNAGDLMQTVTVTIDDDTLVETDELFTLHASGSGLGSAYGTGTIQNDDIAMSSGGGGGGLPTVSISDGWGQEGSGSGSGYGVGFWVSLSSLVSTDVTVSFTHLDGIPPNGATSPADYSIPGPLTIPANESGAFLRFPIVDDALVESSETFSVTLTGASGAGIASGSGSATGTIDDNEPTLDIYDGGGTEGSGSGGGTAWFTINLSPAPTVSTTVNWTVSFASSGPLFANTADFPSLTGSEFVPTGTSSLMIPIPFVDDGLVEDSESFTVTVSASGTNPGDVTADGTINDNEPSISISDWSGSEGSGTGSGNAAFEVTLSRASNNVVTVDYFTFDGTAIDGSDYTGATVTTLTFNPTETSKTISIPIIDDAVVESGGAEIFSVNLTNAVGATIADLAGMGNISDNEPEISIADGEGTEWTFGFGSGTGSGSGAGQVRLEVTLNRTSIHPVTVNYAATVDLAQPLPYRASSSDFGPSGISGTVTFSPGDTSTFIVIPIVDDNLVEFDENFKVSLSSANAALISSTNGWSLGTIHDNEPSILISDWSGSESASGSGSGSVIAHFEVTLSRSSASVIAVDYITSSGTATDGNDYTGVIVTTLTFIPGETTKTINIPIIDNDVFEFSEHFYVNLSNAIAATITDPVGDGTINDDEQAANPDLYSIHWTEAPLTASATDGILVNDTILGSLLSVAITDDVDHGTLAMTTSGANAGDFTYTPDSDFIGTDTFTYKFITTLMTSNEVTVTLYVWNIDPIATDDIYEFNPGTTLIADIPYGFEPALANDLSMDDDPITMEVVTGTTQGTLTILDSATGAFQYTPPSSSLVGSDTFTYRISDGISQSTVTGIVWLLWGNPASGGPPGPAYIPYTTAMLRADAIAMGIADPVIDLPVVFNSKVGNAFEKFALAAIARTKNGQTFPSLARAAATIGLVGGPFGNVIPDATSGPLGPTPITEFYEIKAKNGGISRSYSRHQPIGEIDALAAETRKNNMLDQAVLFWLTTANTTISKDVVNFANVNSVNMYQYLSYQLSSPSGPGQDLVLVRPIRLTAFAGIVVNPASFYHHLPAPPVAPTVADDSDVTFDP